jgi:ATP-binding cassette subfamily C protein CydCD
VKPVDPRLFRYTRGTRAFLILSVLLGLVGAVLVIAQAVLIADVVVGAFQRGHGLGALRTDVLLLAAVAAGRAAVAWLTETAAHRAGAAAKSQLRAQLLHQATRLGPGWLTGQRTGELTALATGGIDALDDYFARYLPQLALAVVVPAVVLARILAADWISAAVIAVTLPLIPLFMVLIGMATQSRMDRQWRLLARLSHHFLDVVAGLPTLKVFGRAKAQAEAIRRITDEYRRATMRTLRIAFLSSFVLELLSTLSVALVAVGIGLRLVKGELDLATGLLVLVLAPEAYAPLRQVGAHYHAAAQGLAAAEEIFAVLQAPPPAAGTHPVPEAATSPIVLDGVTVTYPGRPGPALNDVSLTVAPGETVALTGPSGAGKSTLLSVLLGFTVPDHGTVRVGGRDLAQLSPEQWHARIAWVPQHPHLFAGTIADNVRLARPDATDAQVRRALGAAHALDFTDALLHGTATRLGEGGSGLSAGQRQRIALARAFLADRPIVLLDEPTANLDSASEAAVVAAVRTLATGRTMLLTAHRPALLALADRHVALTAPTPTPADLVEDGPPHLAPHQQTVPQPEADAAPPAGHGPGAARSGTRSGRPLRRVTAMTRSSGMRPRLALAALLGALALGCAVALMATSGWLISRAAQQPPVLYLMVAMTAVRTFGLGRSVFRYCERLVAHDAVFRALGVLRTRIYRRLEQLAPNGLRLGDGTSLRRGDLLSRLVADVDALQDHVLRFRLPAAAAAIVSLGASAGMAALLPAAGAVLAAGLLAAGAAVPALSTALSRRTERQQAPAKGELATEIVDLLSGTAELTVAGALPRRLAATRAADARLTRLAARSATTAGTGSGLIALLSGLTVAASAAVGVQATATGHLNGTVLAVLLLTPLAAFEAVAPLPAAAQLRQRSHQAARRLLEVIDAPVPVHEPAHPAPAPDRPLPLRVRALTATWPGRTTPALSGLDLDLAPGRRVAVVGPSGSGKTTLAQVLLRFLDPAAGHVTLGEQRVDTAAMDGDAVRRIIGLCAQDAHIFDSSLRENLRLARPSSTEAQLRTALTTARLADWVDALPQGLDTMVGAHGARLSGGQRQRLALARALLADFPVLVLDEPAEHLDLATADALTADLLAATEGRATLLITHRLAGLADRVDEIIVLDHGRVSQRGGWDDLVTQQGPLQRMWEHEQATDQLLVAAA